MTDSKVAASIKKALAELGSVDGMTEESKKETEKKRQKITEEAQKKRREIKNEAQRKRRQIAKKKREAERKVREELGTLLLEIDNEEGDFAGFKNRTIAEFLDAVFDREPGADAHGLESEGETPSDSAGTEGSEPYGTDNGSEGGYPDDGHQYQG